MLPESARLVRQQSACVNLRIHAACRVAEQQTRSFFEGAGDSGRNQTPRLSLLCVGFCTRDDPHTEENLDLAQTFWQRFDNVFKSNGTVRGGAIDLVEPNDTREQLANRRFVGTPKQLIEKLQAYTDLGVHSSRRWKEPAPARSTMPARQFAEARSDVSHRHGCASGSNGLHCFPKPSNGRPAKSKHIRASIARSFACGQNRSARYGVPSMFGIGPVIMPVTIRPVIGPATMPV